MSTFVSTVKKAAAEALSEKPANNKTNYISRETWNLIEEKKRSIEQKNWDEVDRLNKEIIKAAREDKQRERIHDLEELDSKGEYKWDRIMTLRKPFNPKRSKFKNKREAIKEESQCVEEAAKDLDTEQWAAPIDTEEKQRTRQIDDNLEMPHEG
jgi:hypothetical protein